MNDDKTELVTSATRTMDGISGHCDETVGQETKRSGRFRGVRLKFLDAAWETKSGDEIAPETRLIFIDIDRIITRWGADRKPIGEPVVLEPGEKWPDYKAWNDALPRSEWIQGMNGTLEGPWRPAQIIHLLDPKSMGEYHWVDNTTGGGIAISDAVGSIKAMRRFRPGAAPIVELSSTHMPTKYGGRQRPNFKIHGWVSLPGEESKPVALPAPDAPTAAVQPNSITLKAVKPVSVGEELDDSIPW